MLHCRSYTHARRFPLVIGKVGGYALPTPLTPTQVVVLLGTVVTLLLTRRHWAHLPGPLNLVVAMALPVVLAWAVRHARVEGRAPLRFARGVMTYCTRPRGGLQDGRSVRAARPTRMTVRTLTVARSAGDRPAIAAAGGRSAGAGKGHR